MTQGILVAVVLAGLALTWFQTRANTKVAEKILQSNAEVAAKAAEDSKANTIALGAIHTLVNSNLTEAQRRELDATRVMLASLREIVRLKQGQGQAVTAEALEAIKIAEVRVTDLARNIGIKQHQTDIADEEVKRQTGEL